MTEARERFLAALRRELGDATPVWFMRQAGRSLPPYRELRRRWGLLEIVHRPELCSEVTCLPVELLGVDAAVLFADIMLPLEGMGVRFEIRENYGPVVPDPIRTAAQVERLRGTDPHESVPYLLEAIRQTRERLGQRAGLVGFGPSPFTLACYLIEGGASRDYPMVRALMHAEPQVFGDLMARLTTSLTDYLLAQGEAGVDAVQVFDSWVGVLDAASFRRHLLPHLRRLFVGLQGRVPAIYFSTGSGHLLEAIADTGAPGISVDWRLPLSTAWEAVGHDRLLQGNLDPAAVLAPWEALRELTEDVLRQAGRRPGHIFNLGHGVLPQSDPDQLRRLVDLVHSSTAS